MKPAVFFKCFSQYDPNYKWDEHYAIPVAIMCAGGIKSSLVHVMMYVPFEIYNQRISDM